MKKNLNLVEILKDVPEGTELYCTLYGKVTLKGVFPNDDFPITVISEQGRIEAYQKNGKYFCGYDDAECMLFPSKDQRDWSKFVPPLKKGTPVIVSENGKDFILRFYFKENSCYISGDKDGDTLTWATIIPFDKFDPNNIEESLKYNIVKEK